MCAKRRSGETKAAVAASQEYMHAPQQLLVLHRGLAEPGEALPLLGDDEEVDGPLSISLWSASLVVHTFTQKHRLLRFFSLHPLSC